VWSSRLGPVCGGSVRPAELSRITSWQRASSRRLSCPVGTARSSQPWPAAVGVVRGAARQPCMLRVGAARVVVSTSKRMAARSNANRLRAASRAASAAPMRGDRSHGDRAADRRARGNAAYPSYSSGNVGLGIRAGAAPPNAAVVSRGPAPAAPRATAAATASARLRVLRVQHAGDRNRQCQRRRMPVKLTSALTGGLHLSGKSICTRLPTPRTATSPRCAHRGNRHPLRDCEPQARTLRMARPLSPR